MNGFIQFLKEEEMRKEEVYNGSLKCFCSNDYLSLSKNRKVTKAAILDIKINGVGSGGSKFINGFGLNYKLVTEKMKEIKQCDDCLIFTSGYTANIGIFESLVTNQDIVFLDEECHASTFAGVRLSRAKFIRFKHNDIIDLKSKLKKYLYKGEKIIIATEVVFSMSGDLLGNHNDYIDIAKEYNALLITDEAHSFGVIELDFKKYDLHLKMGTFSKAVGVLGGYVCGEGKLIETVRQFAKSGIYTTALPSHLLASILTSLTLIQTGEVNGEKALKNARIFDPNLKTQIAFIKCDKAIKLEQALRREGFFVKAIRKPTVKQAGIRVTFNNLHKKIDIKKLRFIISQNLNK